MRELRQPDRAIPEEDTRRGCGRRQPCDRGGDDPLPAGAGGSRRAGRGDRGRGLLPEARPVRAGIGSDAITPRCSSRRCRCSCGLREPDPARSARLAGRRRRDHGRDVLATDVDPDGGHQPVHPHSCDGHPVLGRTPVLHGRLAGRPSRRDDHGYACRRRDDGCLGVQRVRDALPRCHPPGRPPPGDLLRQLDDHHWPHSSRPLAGGPGEEPGNRCDPEADRPPGSIRAARP